MTDKLTRAVVEAFEKDVRTRYDLQEFSVNLLGFGGLPQAIELCNLVVKRRKHGTGTAVMHELCRFADHYDLPIRLTPASKGHHGTTSRARLVRFYRRFGFRENRGRYRDFTTMAGMIRPTQT